MDIAILVFLTSGLFLGWSLGANDAANVFGTAVGTGMVRFATAAIVCSVFVILGAVISGAGAAHTLGKLGSINAIAGSFMAAFSAAITVYWMTRLELPVSTSQAVVGAIIGWNFFSSSITDNAALLKIVLTWIACPILAGFVAVPIFQFVKLFLRIAKLHLFRVDAYTRAALIFAGAMGSYSLGANNIANVMGVFVDSSPFTDFDVGGLFRVTSIQQLFLIGAIAIGVGVFTYSKRVMMTVGNSLLPLSPVAAWVVVISHSIVLLLFSSVQLEHFLASKGLPTIPLVPVSSSQAVVGAVIGIALLKGGRGINWRILGGISVGWITTPVISAVICFFSLFFLQNVFNQQVYHAIHYSLPASASDKLAGSDVDVSVLQPLLGVDFDSAGSFRDAWRDKVSLKPKVEKKIIDLAEMSPMYIDPDKLARFKNGWLTTTQYNALRFLAGRTYKYKWELADDLVKNSRQWALLPENTMNKLHNKDVESRLSAVFHAFATNN